MTLIGSALSRFARLLKISIRFQSDFIFCDIKNTIFVVFMTLIGSALPLPPGAIKTSEIIYQIRIDMLVRLAIPTYKRSDSISSKTLKFLKSVNYPPNLIYLFVVAEEEHIYRDKVSTDLYGHIILGPVGLCAMRNRITDFFEEGEIIIQMDDDIRGLKSTLPFSEIISILLEALRDSTKPVGLAGVLPNDDTRRFKNSQTYHLAHILGSFFVIRNHKDIQITHTEKEDKQRSILYFKKYGRVLRFQGAGVSTSYRGGTGGLQSEGRDLRIKIEIESLMKLYPGFCKVVNKKGDGKDIALLWTAKKTNS